jgi:sugar/nucleoside kinase (ribokinase family)
MSKLDILTVGAPIMDFISHVDENFINDISGGKGGMCLVSTPEMDELLIKVGGNVVVKPGGSAANTCCGMIGLGMSGAHLGKIGSDEIATLYKSEFARIGGDIDRFKQSEKANGRCLSLVTPDSERTMRSDLSAAVELGIADITERDFKQVGHLHIEGYLLFNEELFGIL